MIMGIDPALCHTGIVILNEKGKIENNYVIKSKLMGVDRIREIVKKIREIINIFDVKHIVIEGYSYGSTWNMKSILELAELVGSIKVLCHKIGLKPVIVAPSTLKKFITGKGNTKKNQVLKFVYKNYKLDFSSDDEADAFGLAMIGYMLQNLDKVKYEYQKEVLMKLKEVN